MKNTRSHAPFPPRCRGRLPRVLAAVLCLALLPAGPALGEDPADALYAKIKKTSFPSSQLGVQLGKLRTPRAKERLNALVSEGNLFERHVAMWGLLALDDRATTDMLIQRLSDASWNSTLTEAFSADIEPHLEALRNAYDSGQEALRKAILELLGRARRPGAEALLKAVAADRASAHRSLAIGLLLTRYPGKNDRYFKELAGDDGLPAPLRAYLASHNPRASALLAAIDRSKFLGDKINLGRKLGKLPPAVSQGALLWLLTHDHYWNRQAAASGLMELAGPGGLRPLLEARFSDHMIRSVIDREFSACAARHTEDLMQLFGQLPDDGPGKERKRWLLAHLGTRGGPALEMFLRQVVAGNDPALRQQALAALVPLSGPGQRPYFLGFVNDPALKPYALAFLARRGKKEDLPLFREALKEGWAASSAIPAISGVAAFGDAALQRETYEAALAGGDDAVRLVAMKLFSRHRSEAIERGLAAAVAASRSFRVRLAAGEQLVGGSSREAVPALIKLLNEPYQAQVAEKVEPVLFMLMPLVMIGIDAAGGDFSGKKRNMARHRARMQGYARALARITRVDHGTSYAKWKVWAQQNGITVPR